MKRRPIYKQLYQRLQDPRKLIQVLLGPRQIGKTTLVLQLAEELKRPCHYITADLATLHDLSWIEQQWNVARQLVDPNRGALLIIDEVQKIKHWSDMIKSLWDEDTRRGINLSVILLGSSPWLVQKGLTESLAGRFEVLPVTHWSFSEMEDVFGWSIDDYLYFGGYPGAAHLADRQDSSRWTQYINDSIIETTISRDILLMAQINKPALLRRLFQLGCNYSGQILSYTKMMGELQDVGNTTTLAHYLELLNGAGLLGGLQKFAIQPFRRKGSSPKFGVYNTALMSAQSDYSFEEAKKDRPFWGRLVESSVGAYLMNSIRGTKVELFYWREGDQEVDFVLKRGTRITAIEVKSGRESLRCSGMDTFVKNYQPSKVLLIGEKGLPLKKFLKTPLENLID